MFMKQKRRSILSVLVCMAMIAASLYVAKVEVQAKKTYEFQFIPEGTYNIISVANPGMNIDLRDNSMNDGARIQLWSNANTKNQRFVLEQADNQWYYIKVVSSGKYLDLDYQNVTGSGATVSQYYWHGGHNQQWAFLQAGTAPNVATYIVNRASFDYGYWRALTIKDNVLSTGVDIVSSALSGDNCQTWVFVPTVANEVWTPIVGKKDTQTFVNRFQYAKDTFPYTKIRVISYADMRYKTSVAPDLKVRVVKGTYNKAWNLKGSKYRYASSVAWDLPSDGSKKFKITTTKQTGGYYLIVGVK